MEAKPAATFGSGSEALPNLGELLKAYCDGIENVQSWGANIIFDEATRRQLARLVRLVGPVDAAHDGVGKRRPVEPTESTGPVEPTTSPTQSLGGSGVMSGWDEVLAQAEEPPADASDASVQATELGQPEGTTKLLLQYFSPEERFTAAEAIERLARNGHPATRGAVATALSRWNNKFFDRVEHGVYRVLPQGSGPIMRQGTLGGEDSPED